jgi:hypothetical protein
MVLVSALFSVDTYYQVLLSGAVERALDLEAVTDAQIRITRYLNNNARVSKISYLILFMYLTLLASAVGLGIVATGGQIGLNQLYLLWWILGFVWSLVAGSIILYKSRRRRVPSEEE